MKEPEWNQIRAFQATAETGSLSAAARKLGLTQPTLSRQVALLEAALDTMLFERLGKRLVLTRAGGVLLQHADVMEAAARDLGLAASSQSASVEGTVSISASDGVAMFVLPPIVEHIRKAQPGIRLNIVVSNALSDLQRREADIAIRHVRPDNPELVALKARESEAGFYASRDWLASNGPMVTAADARGATFIGYDGDGQFLNYLKALGLEIDEGNFGVSSQNAFLAAEMARRGLGIAVLMKEVAEEMPELEAVLTDLAPITFPFWLVAHGEVKTARRVRLVFDMLAERLGNHSTKKAASIRTAPINAV